MNGENTVGVQALENCSKVAAHGLLVFETLPANQSTLIS